MGFWDWLLGRSAPREDLEEDSEPAEPQAKQPVRLPTEALVFECHECGKVFDARRLHPACPECDGEDVERLSD